MPAPRSASALAKLSNMNSSRSLDRWRGVWRWVERAEAYDTWMLQQAMAAQPKENGNPYERMLMQTAGKAEKLNEAAMVLLSQATRRMQWAEKQFAKAVAQDPNAEPPAPPPALVAAIRGAAQVMDQATEAQALALGISDVLAMQAKGAAAQ